MDPCSRHQVWSLLKSRRAGRVTVLSTHYMDEADILAGTPIFSLSISNNVFIYSRVLSIPQYTYVFHSPSQFLFFSLSFSRSLLDRKAVISQGQLKCVGSSLYLKTKCGVGYHLR